MPDQATLNLLNGKYKNTMQAIYDRSFKQGQMEGRSKDLIEVLERIFDVHDEALFDRIRKEEQLELLVEWFHDATRRRDEAAVRALCARILDTPRSPR